jgi:hypothetical protein
VPFKQSARAAAGVNAGACRGVQPRARKTAGYWPPAEGAVACGVVGCLEKVAK